MSYHSDCVVEQGFSKDDNVQYFIYMDFFKFRQQKANKQQWKLTNNKNTIKILTLTNLQTRPKQRRDPRQKLVHWKVTFEEVEAQYRIQSSNPRPTVKGLYFIARQYINPMQWFACKH